MISAAREYLSAQREQNASWVAAHKKTDRAMKALIKIVWKCGHPKFGVVAIDDVARLILQTRGRR